MQKMLDDIAKLMAQFEAKQMSENADTFDVGDLVYFTSDEVRGFGGIEATDTDADVYTVRLYARAGTEFEPTDQIYTLSVSQLSRSEDVDEDDDDPISEGDAVEYESESGNVKAIVQSVSHESISAEVYALIGSAYEPTGVEVTIPIEDAKKCQPIAIVQTARRIMAKMKDVKAELSADDPSVGIIEGKASAYGFVDYGGDTIERGAYTQTLLHNGGSVMLLMDHGYTSKDVAGVAYLTDSDDALMTRAELDLRDPAVKTVFEKIKFLLDRGKKMGLSIGYDAIKKEQRSDGIRVLKEIALHELSITPFPMDTVARIDAAKARKAQYMAKAKGWAKIVTRRKAVPSEQDAVKALVSLFDRQITTIKQGTNGRH